MPRPEGPGRTRPVRARPASSGLLASAAHGPGAVDDRVDRDLYAVGQGDPDATGDRGGVDHRAGVPDEPARVGERAEAVGGHGWHPVAVDVPAPGVVRQEATLVVLVESLPQLGGDRAEAVDRRAPVAGLLDDPAHVGPHDVAQLVERVGAGDARRGRHGGCGGHPVDLGHQVVPRDGVQRTTRTVGGDRDVHHGQAGADEEQVAVGQLGGPGVVDEAVRVGQPGRCPVGSRTSAGGEHDGSGGDRLAGREPDQEPVPAAVDPGHRLVTAFEAGVAGVLRRGLQQARHVVAVHAPGHEVLGLGVLVVVPAHPSEEVLRVAWEGAHPARGHVEQVPVVLGGVRRPAARAGVGVDQGHPVTGGQRRQQVRGSECPSGARADHDDATVAFSTAHGRLQSPVTM